MKKNLIGTLVALFLSIILPKLMYGEISLLHFINASFCISAGLLLLSLLTMVIQKGFFDAIFHSFRTTFQVGARKEERNEITPISQLITFNYSPLVVVGVVLFIIMLGALYNYTYEI
jgi:hypothetical protein